MIKGILRNKTVWVFIAAILTAYALIADFSVYASKEDTLFSVRNAVLQLFLQFRKSVDGNGSMFTIIAVSLACLYKKIDSYASCRYRRFIFAAILIAFLTVFYYSYSIGGSISLMYCTGFQILKSLVFLSGYSFLFYFSIIGFYQFSGYASEKAINKSGERVLYRNYVVILTLLWAPHLIVKLPGAFTSDTRSQITQSLRLSTYTSHHPIFITWVFRICMRIGQRFFSSYNAGMLIYFFMQSVFLILVFSYTLYYLDKKGISKTIRNIIWLIYAFCPLITGYLGVVLKDVLYSACFLLFVVFCVHYLEDEEGKIRWITLIGLATSGALTILTRNNGKEIVYPTVFVICLVTIWKNRKEYKQCFRAVLAFILPILCAAAVSEGLVQHYQIIPGSIAEALSLPFQQTARTVLEHGDEIPEEEKEVIDIVLQYDSLAERYNPMVSDPVKGMYYSKAGRDALAAYLKVWFRQFFRYPLTYFEATMHQNHQLFSILSDNYYFYNLSVVKYEEQILVHEYPILEKIESVFVSYYKLCYSIPILSLFSKSSFYCITLLILTIFVWCDKRYKMFLVLLPLWLTIGICILGPVINGNPRYTFPVVYSMPFVYGYYISEKRKDGTQ